MHNGLLVAVAILVLIAVLLPAPATSSVFGVAAASTADATSHSPMNTAEAVPATVASPRTGAPAPLSLMLAGSALIAVGVAMKRARKKV